MSQEEKTYYVRIKGPFTASHRVRAGVVVSVEDGYAGPLTPEQLKAVKADNSLTVSTSEPAKADPSVLAEAEAKAKEIVDSATTVTAQAEADAKKVLAEAEAKAKEIVERAEADAKAQVEAAQKQADAIVAEAKKTTK